MASLAAKAALMDQSMKRLQSNIDQLSKMFGVDPLKLTEHDRDPELLMAYRMQDMANWTEGLVKHFEETPIVEALEGEPTVNEDAQDSSGDADIDKKSTRGKAKGRS